MRFIFIFVLLSATKLHATPHYEFTPACTNAADEIFKLRLESAQMLLDQEKIENPDNLIPYLLEDYIDFFRIYLSEDELLYYDLSKRRNQRLSKLSRGPQSDPFYRFCLAEVYLHWSIARLKFEEYMGAFLNAKKAFSLLEKNKEDFPGFIYHLKSLALLHILIGTIPEEYQWGAEKLGFTGSITEGMAELDEVVAYCRLHRFPFHPEVKVLRAFLELHLFNNGEKAWDWVSQSDFACPDDLLAFYTKASIALYTGHNEEAIALIDQRPSGEGYLSIPFFDYLRGLAALRSWNPHSEEYFKRFLQNFHGRNYIKSAWQKIAWSRLLQGDEKGYQEAMVHVKKEGFLQIDEDRAAYAALQNKFVPDKQLLKARLLCDAGQYVKAYSFLGGLKPYSFSRPVDILEYQYRMGRICQNMNKPRLAASYFSACIQAAPLNSPCYYPAYACLQMALINEKEGRPETARHYFLQALNYPNHSYTRSIESSAKAGLARLK